MKIKLKAFTLIEMLVTLTLFTLAMAAILQALGMGLRFMDRAVGTGDGKNKAALVSRIIQNQAQKSFSARESEDGIWLTPFDENEIFIRVFGNEISFSNGQYYQNYEIEGCEEMLLSLHQSSGRQAVEFFADFGETEYRRLYLMGYQRTTTIED